MVDFTKHVKDWPAYVHRKLQSDWTLSPTLVENCENYFLRHWEYDYLSSKVDISDQVIIWLNYEGTRYQVLFQPSMAHVIGMHKQVALSFRKPLAELNLPAYVLVKGIENK